MIIERGDILLVDLEPVKGSEQGKIRPCLVIQNNLGNSSSPTTVVAAITSNTEKEYPFTVKVDKGEGNLPKDSLIQLNQIRTISMQDRAIKKIGKLANPKMNEVNEAIKVSLGL
ncbi:MAG: type II toxin-antitoxin system PemK/MazF family toxin [archaeon]